MIVYETPNYLDENRVHIISEEKAIQVMKDLARTKGNSYTSGEEALQDYLTVHWAYQVDSIRVDGEIVKSDKNKMR
ncbi:MAG: hypothetical protein WC055_00185 [Melioribacteraceae bacterium]